MVEPVVALLIGRGHPVRRARDVGLATDDDAVLGDYVLIDDLVIVTFDPDFRSSARRKGARCLHIRPPERTARERMRTYYREVVALFWDGARLVTLPANAPPRADQLRAVTRFDGEITAPIRPLGGTVASCASRGSGHGCRQEENKRSPRSATRPSSRKARSRAHSARGRQT
jgi:predicted nuclease of predicted toxin-antitoxin system